MAVVEPQCEEETSAAAVDQLKWIFDLCDQDHDGLITVGEFRSLGQHYLGAVSQRIDQLIHELDPNGSGVITFENFRRGIETYLLARRDSIGSSRSDSHSRASFEENYMPNGSPIDDNAFTVGDLTMTTPSKDSSYYSLGFTTTSSSPLSIHREANGLSETDSHETYFEEGGGGDGENQRQGRLERGSSIQGIEIQPSDNSPTLVARALLKRGNHSLLHVSEGGVANSYGSTPEWRYEDEEDELTEKLQELSTRLEGLEVELDTSQSERMKLRQENDTLRERLKQFEDTSQSERMKLRRENNTLRERLEQFEDTLRDTQCKSEETIGMVRSKSTATMEKLKRQYSTKFQELEYQIVEEQEKYQTAEGRLESLKRQLDDKDSECQEKSQRMLSLQVKISELDDQLLKTQDQLRLVRNELERDRLDHSQEIEAMNHVIIHLRKELEESKFVKKRNSTNSTDYKLAEVISLRKETQSLKEENTRLKSQLVRQGKELLEGPPPSLATELQDAPRADVMKALTEHEELNARLQAYIESLLVTILDSHPELLEVKT